MIQVAANPSPLAVDVPGALGRAGELVAEPDVGMDPVADGLHARPTGLRLAAARTTLMLENQDLYLA